MSELSKKCNILQSKLDVPFTDLNDVNNCIKDFCEIVNECVLPHVDITEVKCRGTQDFHKNQTNKNKGDKPWFIYNLIYAMTLSV